MTLKMTTAQVVETSVTVTNSSFQNYTHPDDHTRQTTDTPGFKPFTKIRDLFEPMILAHQEFTFIYPYVAPLKKTSAILILQCVVVAMVVRSEQLSLQSWTKPIKTNANFANFLHKNRDKTTEMLSLPLPSFNVNMRGCGDFIGFCLCQNNIDKRERGEIINA